MSYFKSKLKYLFIFILFFLSLFGVLYWRFFNTFEETVKSTSTKNLSATFTLVDNHNKFNTSLNNVEALSVISDDFQIFSSKGVLRSVAEVTHTSITNLTIIITDVEQTNGVYLDNNKKQIRSYSFETDGLNAFLKIFISDQHISETDLNYALIEYIYKMASKTGSRDISEITPVILEQIEKNNLNNNSLILLEKKSSSISKFSKVAKLFSVQQAYAQCSGTWACGDLVTECNCSDGSGSCSGSGSPCNNGNGTCNCVPGCLQRTLTNCSESNSCQPGTCSDCTAANGCYVNTNTCPSGQYYCGAQGSCSAGCRNTGGLTCQQWLDANCGGGGGGGSSTPPPSTHNWFVKIEGYVYSCGGGRASGVRVAARDNGYGDDIIATTTTDANGYYKLDFDPEHPEGLFHLHAGQDGGGSGNYKAKYGGIPTIYNQTQTPNLSIKPDYKECNSAYLTGWVLCNPGLQSDLNSWWTREDRSERKGGFDFEAENCNQPPQCTISGSTTAIVNQPNNYSIAMYDPEGSFNYSQAFVGRTNMDPSDQTWVKLGSDISYTPDNVTRTWTCTDPGQYYILCNARDTTGLTPSGQCTGNPWCDGTISSCANWSNCGTSDRITVTCSQPAPYCGDQIVNQSSEQCDDGNTTNTDACVKCKNAFCGDGYIRNGVEQCDDGNTTNGDGCSSSCTIEITRTTPTPSTVSCGQNCSSSAQCTTGQSCYQNICQLDECVGKNCTCTAASCGSSCNSVFDCPNGNICSFGICKIPECENARCTCSTIIPSITLSHTETCNSWGDPRPTLSWNAVSGAAEYRVYRNSTAGQTPTIIPAGGVVTGTSFTDATAFANNETVHNYRVQAYNSSGIALSTYSNTITIGAYRCPVACDPDTNWNAWGSCSLSCGGGTQYRTNNCAGVPPESRSCNTQSCCNSSSWSAWSTCSASCGGGTQYRTNSCGDRETRSCNTQSCCTPNCSGFQCGQSDGCRGTCSDSDDRCNFSTQCGQVNVCGNRCPNTDNTCNFSPRCGQTNACGTSCSDADNGNPTTVRNLSPTAGNYRVTSNQLSLSWSAPSDGLADQYEIKVYRTGSYSSPDSANCSSSTVTCATRTATNYNHTLVEAQGINLTYAIRAINTSCGTDQGPWITRNINLVQNITGNFYLDNGSATQSGGGICSGGGTAPASVNTSSNLTASTGGTANVQSSSFDISNVPYSPASWSTTKNTVTLNIFNTSNSANTHVCACPSDGNLYTCEYDLINAPQNNVNFYFTTHDLSHDPWWQSRGGHVYSGNSLHSEIPDTCESDSNCAAYLVTKEYVASTLAAFHSISAGIPIIGTGSLDTNGGNHITDRAPQPRVIGSSQSTLSCEGYATLSKNIDLTSVEQLSGTIRTKPVGTLVDTDANVYAASANGSLTIAPLTGETWTVATGETLLIFVSDNLTVEDRDAIEQLFVVEEGGFLGFIAQNNIIFTDSVGYTEGDILAEQANVEGLFIANNITIQGSTTDTVVDKKFIAAGTLVGCNQVAFQRDFDNLALGKEYNATIPTETVQFRPDIARNFPNILKKSNLVWQEVN